MTAFHIIANACTGRGFSGTDANGFLKNFLDWVTHIPNDATVGNRGPGWYNIDNQSTLVTDPYIVISDQAAPTPNSRARIIQVKMVTGTAQQIQCHCWFYWNSVTHTGTGVWAIFNIPTVDSGLFAYDFRGGPDCMWLASYIAGTLIFGAVETWTGLSTYCEPESALSTLQTPFYLEAGDSGNQLGGYEGITGIVTNGVNTNVDANGNLHFSLINTSGTTYRIDAFKDAARTLRVGFTGTFTNTATGSKTFTADNTTVAGIGGAINLTATATPNILISCRFGRVDVAAGKGVDYKVNDPYFLFDATTGSILISYLRVMAISGDTLTLSSHPQKLFPAGTLIGAYPHRFVAIYQRNFTSVGVGLFMKMPYVSKFGSEYTDQTGTGSQRLGQFMLEMQLLHSGFDRYGNAWMQPIGVLELLDNSASIFQGYRLYGLTNNFKCTNLNSLSPYSFGRTLNAKNYIDILHSANGSVTDFAGLTLNAPFMALTMRDTPETV